MPSTGIPFLNFNGVNVISGTTLTPTSYQVGIQLNSGYTALHYMFVGSENGVMPTFTASSTTSNVVTLTGYYQQLFTFNTTNAKVLISGLNSKDSNFLIADTNGTPLYSWIEAYNTTSLTVWSKVPNGTTSVNFEVFPEFDNLLSATGYMGEAPQLSATYNQFNNWGHVGLGGIFFNNSTSELIYNSYLAGDLTVNNGIHIAYTYTPIAIMDATINLNINPHTEGFISAWNAT